MPPTGYGGDRPTVVPVLGNGHWDEPSEPQQSLSSWAEFLAEEPAQSAGRNGKPKPSSLSLFEWTLGNEQERGRNWSAQGAIPLRKGGLAGVAMAPPPAMYVGFLVVRTGAGVAFSRRTLGNIITGRL